MRKRVPATAATRALMAAAPAVPAQAITAVMHPNMRGRVAVITTARITRTGGHD